MSKNNIPAIRSELHATAALLAIAAAISAAPALAQPPAGDTPPAAPAAPTELAASDEGAIIVTGSHILRTDLESSTPVAVVSNSTIQQSGAANILDTLAQLPSVGQNFGRSDSNFSSTANGASLLNLRNLGSARTLVLINGRRTVGLPETSATDLNNIPTDFIDRVEVVTGGASAVYGSEAIAGVANFILKDKFDGIRVRAQNTISDKGDAARQYVSLTGGQSFADDAGHVIINVGYDNDHGLRSRDRSFSAKDNPNRSSYAAQGLFSFTPLFLPDGSTYTFDANNNLKPYQGANVDGYNRNNDRYLSLPVERYNAALIGNYQFSDAVTAYVEGEYSHTKANNGLEPSATGNAPPLPVLEPDGSPYPGIPLTNPFIPPALLAAVTAYNAANAGTPGFTPVTALQFRRRSNDIFDRSSDVKRNYYRGVIGLKGDIGSDWHWDAYYQHSQSDDRTRAENVLATNYGAALNSVRDASGNIVCADPAERAAGCVPLNIFGFNTASQAAIDWLETDPGPALGGLVAGQHVYFGYDAKVKQDVANAVVNGSLFQLPGGAVSLAVGAEYRREASTETFDPYSHTNLTLSNQLPDVIGKFNVKEAFAELVAPIVADRPWLHYLGLEGAARYADYSTVGGVWSWKAGGDYAPSRDIRFRAIYAQATRAPNIGELYAPQGQTFIAITDPCDQGQTQGDAAVLDPSLRIPLPAGCGSIPGVQAQSNTAQGFTYSTAQLQQTTGLIGGNQDLKQETAHTITAGVVLTPQFARALSLTVDYYKIKVKNAINIIGQQNSIDQCFASGNPLFCSNVIRDPNGFITAVNDLSRNIGSVLVEGLDVEGRLHSGLSRLNVPGTVDLSVFWNHLFSQEQTAFPGAPPSKEVGQLDCYNCGRLGTGFRNKVFVTGTYSLDNWSLNYRVNYYSPVVDTLGDGAIRVPAYFYHNFQLRVDVGDKKQFGFYGGVNNLFDKKPPVFPDTNLVTFPGTQTVADTYDTYGRMLYAGVEVNF